MMKDGALLKAEGGGFRVVDLSAGDVGGQQVGGELNAVEVRLDTLGQGFDGLGLGQPGSALDQYVTASQQADEYTVDQMFLTENVLAHEGLQLQQGIPMGHVVSVVLRHGLESVGVTVTKSPWSRLSSQTKNSVPVRAQAADPIHPIPRREARWR